MRRWKLSTAELANVTMRTSSSSRICDRMSCAARYDSVYVLPLPGTAETPMRPPVYFRISSCAGLGLNMAQYLLNPHQQRPAFLKTLLVQRAERQIDFLAAAVDQALRQPRKRQLARGLLVF